jgi:hypothetical protein
MLLNYIQTFNFQTFIIKNRTLTYLYPIDSQDSRFIVFLTAVSQMMNKTEELIAFDSNLKN